jgi:DNA repair exonuclease SbcCD nuclease subunit
MLKILAIGDPHSKKNNQNEIEKCADLCAEKVLSEKPKAVVILGDLANDHERLYLSALNGIVYFFDKICIAANIVEAKVYYIVGNHDYINNAQFLTDSHAFNAFKKWQNLVIIDKPMRLKSSDGYITMCPYVPVGRFVEALDTIGRDKWTESTVIFCHQEFKNATDGFFVSKNGDEWNYDNMVISGHIHTAGKLQDNVFYVGSPYDITFGDEGTKGIYLVELESNKVSDIKYIDIGMPRKMSINVTIEEAKQYQPDDLNKVRMYISGTTQEFNEFKKTEHYIFLAEKVKIIPQITDPVKIVRNIKRRSYLDVLAEECEKENSMVKEMLKEVLNENKA